jgi:hypothetical protein
MSSWFERWRQRQREIIQGVDADLFSDNDKRYRLGFGLLGLGFVLSLFAVKFHIPSALRMIVRGIASVSFLAGLLLVGWARQQADFLNKPDPEEPPRIFKQ